MQKLTTLAGVSTMSNEIIRENLRSYPIHFRKSLGVDWKGSKTFEEACKNGEQPTVLLWLLGKANRMLNRGMREAAFSGHENIVRLCKEWGATNFNQTMAFAAMKGREKIVRLCKEWGADDFDSTMVCAIMKGHEKIVRLCKEWGFDDLNLVMWWAAMSGRENIVRLCKEWGYNNFDLAMIYAGMGGRENIVRLLEEWGGDDTYSSMEWGYEKIRGDIYRILIEWGADCGVSSENLTVRDDRELCMGVNSFNSIMEWATEGGRKYIFGIWLEIDSAIDHNFDDIYIDLQ